MDFVKAKKWVIKHLKKQMKAEKKDDGIIEKAFIFVDAYLMQKSKALPVGTVKDWKGKKYKKVAPGKWMRYYESSGRGANQAIAHALKKAMAAENFHDLYEVIAQNKSRFTDSKGNMLADAQKIIDMAKSSYKEKQSARGKPTKVIGGDANNAYKPKDTENSTSLKSGKKKSSMDEEGLSNQSENDTDKRIGSSALWNNTMKQAIKTGNKDKINSALDQIEKEYSDLARKAKTKSEKEFLEYELNYRKRDAENALKDISSKDGEKEFDVKSIKGQAGAVAMLKNQMETWNKEKLTAYYNEKLAKIKNNAASQHVKNQFVAAKELLKEKFGDEMTSPKDGESETEEHANRNEEKKDTPKAEDVLSKYDKDVKQNIDQHMMNFGGDKEKVKNRLASVYVGNPELFQRAADDADFRKYYNKMNGTNLSKDDCEKKLEDSKQKLQSFKKIMNLSDDEVSKYKKEAFSDYSGFDSFKGKENAKENEKKEKINSLATNFANQLELSSKEERKKALEDVIKRKGAKSAAGLAAKMLLESDFTKGKEESEDEKHKNRSDAMKGNKNAWKGGIEDLKKKYTSGKSIDGDEDSITLPNGTELEGKWKLVEADAPSASHDETTFSKTVGFPTNEDGSTINDRDYEHDRAAQEAVLDIAADFDSRALSLDSPVVVSTDGVVISGNNRTMSSKIAAKKGTDKKYIEALSKKAKKFGFNADDLKQFKNPRVVFETDVKGKYSTSQFAEFNKTGKKAQSPIETAVKVAKTVKPENMETMTSAIGDAEDMSEIYSDKKTCQNIFNSLISTGVISKTDLPQYFTSETGITNNGKEFLETVMIGSVINEDNIRAISGDGGKNIRQKLVRAIVPLVENKNMAGYSINKELNDAVRIAVEVAKSKDFKDVDDYAAQQQMFSTLDPVAVEFAKKLTGKTQKAFAEFMQSLNGGLKPAANGEIDIFLGGIESKDDILKRYLNMKKSIQESLAMIFRNRGYC